MYTLLYNWQTDYYFNKGTTAVQPLATQNPDQIRSNKRILRTLPFPDNSPTTLPKQLFH